MNLVFSGERATGQQLSVSLIIARNKFHETAEQALSVTGSFQEGRGEAVGFGRFGDGRRRSIIGELRLKKAGTDPGQEVTGEVQLRIVETHGGVFQPQPPTSMIQAPGPINSPQPFGSPQSLTLLKALDTNRDGTISADEIEKATAVLKQLDRNQDGNLSGDELQDPRK